MNWKMKIKKLNKLAKNILIIKLFNKIVKCCKMFCKKLIQFLKKLNYIKKKNYFFLCLLI